MKTIKVGVIIGSLRKESFNRKMANALIENAPKGMDFEILELGDLEMYNQEYDEKSPQSYLDFRNKVKSKDAFLFVTPEYNRSFPAVIKNAVDIASRPWGQNLWSGKPAAIVSVTVGNLGAFGASRQLLQVLNYLNMPVMGQPEAYISEASKLFDENGKLTLSTTEKFAENFMSAFETWIRLFVK